MRSGWWIGVTAGVAIGLGSVAAVEVATAPASAASAVVTIPQLKRVEKQARTAVKRSNVAVRRANAVAKAAAQDATNIGVINGKLPLWAISSGDVGSDLVRGVNAVSSQRLTDGNYRVRFNRDVSTCSWSATLASTNGTIPAATSIRLALDTTEVTHTQIVVRTGDGAGNPVNSPFQVQVFC